MKIEIYTKDSCSYCTAAKSLLETKNMEYKSIHYPTDVTREEIVDKFPHARTFPVVVINDEWIGGYSELQQVLGGK